VVSAPSSLGTTITDPGAVLYHHGLSASGGHYTLDVLHPNIDNTVGPTVKPREGWIRIDDELVSDVRPEDVFGTPTRGDRCAYLLFYRRVATGVRS
jgi:ubiquitin carboxyl-terminal hydrolase 10